MKNFIVYALPLFFFGCALDNASIKEVDYSSQINLDDENESPVKQKKIIHNRLFKDKTSHYGLSGVKAYNIAVVDFDSDGFSDLVFIPSFFSQPVFYKFHPIEKKFKKVTSLFKNPIKASFVTFVDFNKDNIIDVFVGVLNQKSELSKIPLKLFLGKKSNGKVYFEKEIVVSKASASATVSLIDHDLDGNLDVFVGNWFEKYRDTQIPTTDNFIIWNGKSFLNKSNLLLGEREKNENSEMFINATPTYGSQVCDLDQDGFPDLITTSTNRFQNKLWMNRYDFREKFRYFKNYGLESGVAGDPDGLINKQGGGRSFALACADYNNDQIMDLFIGELTHNYDSEDVDKSSLLTGRTFKFPPKFYRTEYFLDSYDSNFHQADRRAIWVDLNNDGLLDLIVDNSGYPPHSKLIYFEQQGDHSFINKSEEYGMNIVNPISTVIADFNRDGKMDVLTSQSQIRNEKIEPRLYLFENNLELKDHRSIRVFLNGKKSNANALNGTIILKVKTENGIEKRRQIVSYSYGALPPQNEEGVLFGLAPGEKLLDIKVIWPFSKKKNQSRASLEKNYPFRLKFKEFINVTLCESGHMLIGKKSCK